MTDIRLPKQVIDGIEDRWWSRFNKDRRRTSQRIDERLERLRAHRNNIGRYRRLLNTELSDLEREFVDRRLSEEVMAMQLLTADMPPLVMDQPANEQMVGRSGEDQP
ncbi:hypothetical protein [Bradyrhizobium macuxiense]|uniref:hypothetical protein n=1 Tax=Bradyrhizobium macuxiense TaxID=1755647 RepID=UPI000AE8CC91|nr:hypothetical protein [Bradyrhizobium macuxiense]